MLISDFTRSNMHLFGIKPRRWGYSWNSSLGLYWGNKASRSTGIRKIGKEQIQINNHLI